MNSMRELKCPNCGSTIKVDEAMYASIATQVRDSEFNQEVEKREKLLKDRFEAEKKLAEVEISEKFRKEVGEKDVELQKLQAARELDKKQHEQECNMLKEVIERYKDFKAKLSTKMIGESLEQHCSNQYEEYIRPMMPNAVFGKDNEAVEGTKGDFVFRDFEDGVEYISIMFEMKNEADGGGKKHKNGEFLEKLDADRKKKGCEFAVLVSMLEPDSELYNNGIVNKSHLYDKTYVIRPQFFVPFIQLLVQISKKNLEMKKQLVAALSMQVDVTNFEDKLNEFKSGILYSSGCASTNIDKAIKQIEASINELNKVKASLATAQKQLNTAEKKADELTVKRLTHGNTTMKEMFAEARQASGADAGTSTPESGIGAA